MWIFPLFTISNFKHNNADIRIMVGGGDSNETRTNSWHEWWWVVVNSNGHEHSGGSMNSNGGSADKLGRIERRMEALWMWVFKPEMENARDWELISVVCMCNVVRKFILFIIKLYRVTVVVYHYCVISKPLIRFCYLYQEEKYYVIK